MIVGGNVYGYDQTLASAALFDANAARYAEAIASGIVLSALILVVMVTAAAPAWRRNSHAVPRTTGAA